MPRACSAWAAGTVNLYFTTLQSNASIVPYHWLARLSLSRKKRIWPSITAIMFKWDGTYNWRFGRRLLSHEIQVTTNLAVSTSLRKISIWPILMIKTQNVIITVLSLGFLWCPVEFKAVTRSAALPILLNTISADNQHADIQFRILQTLRLVLLVTNSSLFIAIV